ncbi:unnamed protein product, partial [Discosporangium mesarthrocarpum]
MGAWVGEQDFIFDRETELGDPDTQEVQGAEEELILRVELRALAASIVVVISQLDLAQIPYVVENVDPSHRVYYRQKGADWFPWQSVGPGEKRGYTWEEPLLPPRLLIRVGPETCGGAQVLHGKNHGRIKAAKRLQSMGLGIVASEDAGTFSGPVKLIRLDEIGSEERLPLPEWEFEEGMGDGKGKVRSRFMHARVTAEGPTRILLVSSNKDIRK